MHPLVQRHKLALPCVSFPLTGLASTWGTPEQGCQSPRTWNTSVACSLAQPHLGHTSHLKQYDTHAHTHTQSTKHWLFLEELPSDAFFS